MGPVGLRPSLIPISTGYKSAEELFTAKRALLSELRGSVSTGGFYPPVSFGLVER